MQAVVRCWHCRFFAALIALSALLGACGQYGDLYLPPEQGQQQKEQPDSKGKRQDEQPQAED